MDGVMEARPMEGFYLFLIGELPKKNAQNALQSIFIGQSIGLYILKDWILREADKWQRT